MLRGRASRLKYFNFRHKIRSESEINKNVLVGALQLVVVAFGVALILRLSSGVKLLGEVGLEV